MCAYGDGEDEQEEDAAVMRISVLHSHSHFSSFLSDDALTQGRKGETYHSTGAATNATNAVTVAPHAASMGYLALQRYLRYRRWNRYTP